MTDNVTYPASGFSGRQMQDNLPGFGGSGGTIATPPNIPDPQTQGGGNLNGSANTAHMIGHAGTGADRVSVPRQIKSGSGNYCGIV